MQGPDKPLLASCRAARPALLGAMLVGLWLLGATLAEAGTTQNNNTSSQRGQQQSATTAYGTRTSTAPAGGAGAKTNATSTKALKAKGRKAQQGAPATTSEVLADARFDGEKNFSKQYRKTGGFERANRDFDAMARGSQVQDHGGGLRTTTVNDGSKVVVRPTSRGNAQGENRLPTLEIQPQTGKTIKVRYE